MRSLSWRLSVVDCRFSASLIFFWVLIKETPHKCWIGFYDVLWLQYILDSMWSVFFCQCFFIIFCYVRWWYSVTKCWWLTTGIAMKIVRTSAQTWRDQQKMGLELLHLLVLFRCWTDETVLQWLRTPRRSKNCQGDLGGRQEKLWPAWGPTWCPNCGTGHTAWKTFPLLALPADKERLHNYSPEELILHSLIRCLLQ